MRKYRTCIFVNGCFWHGHDGCKYFKMPKTNTAFWSAKITRNKERDQRDQKQLAQLGWHCITVWECQLKPQCRESTLTALEYTLNRIFLHDHARPYTMIEEENDAQIAAEPENGT